MLRFRVGIWHAFQSKHNSVWRALGQGSCVMTAGRKEHVNIRGRFKHGGSSISWNELLHMPVEAQHNVKQSKVHTSESLFSPYCCCSVAKQCLTLKPRELPHARLPYPSLSPGVCSHACPLSQWCHLTILSSASLFSSCLQPFPASRSFPMSQLFASGGQNNGASASASVLPMKIRVDFL